LFLYIKQVKPHTIDFIFIPLLAVMEQTLLRHTSFPKFTLHEP